MTKRTIYLREVSKNEFEQNWGFETYFNRYFTVYIPVYVRCTKQGKINWKRTNVYTSDMFKYFDRPVKIV
jgi:hypothetical protein